MGTWLRHAVEANPAYYVIQLHRTLVKDQTNQFSVNRYRLQLSSITEKDHTIQTVVRPGMAGRNQVRSCGWAAVSIHGMASEQSLDHGDRRADAQIYSRESHKQAYASRYQTRNFQMHSMLINFERGSDSMKVSCHDETELQLTLNTPFF